MDEAALDLILARLNPQQRAAASAGMDPLLIVAGAGTGKTTALVHRVAWLIARGVDPSRVLLLTFTRRAASEMLRRVDGVLRELPRPLATCDVAAAEGGTSLNSNVPAEVSRASPSGGMANTSSRVWGGTFHAVANRLLRRFGQAVGLPPGFSVHDQSDSEDLLNVIRTELGLTKKTSRFPNKSTCLAIYSRCVNAREKLEKVLQRDFYWCKEWRDELSRLFDAYVDRKEAAAVLDYDDLLLYWHALLADEVAGEAIRRMFDCVLVDEYQDTNLLQAEIVYRLCPDGRGLTAVGDDAQSIYSFRAATVRNILDFPAHYPNTTIVKLEQNYRSTQPILAAANRVLSLAAERYEKELWSAREEGELPALVSCVDESDQADFVIGEILEHRERGLDLRRQAVLFRASHHSMVLEAELTRRNIPFHKYGGLKFVETAHIKDLLAFLRLAENPRDVVSGNRVLLLVPGVGPAKARQLMQSLIASHDGFDVWSNWKPPAAAEALWPKFVELLEWLTTTREVLPAQVERVRQFYRPILEGRYDQVPARLRDLEQLELIASRYGSRQRMLVELTLDPPSSTQDFAGPPLLDDDYLVLSTIHSAKGLEWDAVYVIHVSDGNIPSDMGTKDREGIEEERRLFYVALTRARSWLYVCQPLRYYYRPGMSDPHSFAQRTRFLPQSVMPLFEQRVTSGSESEDAAEAPFRLQIRSEGIRRGAKQFWA